jgi:hypothetical protein
VAQPLTVVAGTTVDGAVLGSARLVGVGPASHCWWRLRQVMALLWSMFARSAWNLPATVLARTEVEGTHMAADRLVGLGSAWYCGGGHDRLGRSSGLCFLVRRGLRQPLRWRVIEPKALLCCLLDLSARAQLTTVVADTRVEGAVLDSVRLVSVGSVNHCGGGHDR